MKRAILAVVGAIAAATVLPIALETVSAHNAGITGTAVCQANGTFTVTWTISNDFDSPLTLALTASGGGTLSPTSVVIPAIDSTTATQSGIPGTAASASLAVAGSWADEFPASNSQTVSLPGPCLPHVRPVAVTFTEGDCTTAPRMTVPLETEAYTVAVTGTVGFGNTVTVTFTAKPGYVLDGPVVFTHTFGPAPEACNRDATPVVPEFHEGDCSAAPSMVVPPETEAYTVTVTGTAGFGNTVTVTFTAKPGYVLTGETVFTHTFGAAPENCGTTTTVEKTLSFQVLGPICIADHPYIRWTLAATGLLPSQNLATITITDVSGNVVATLTNQPFNGQTLWPGASLDPEDWPGWVKIGGVWYTDPSDAVLRQGVFVQADVNPTAGPQFVAYPEATAACAQPELLDSPTTTSAIGTTSLPVTGSSTGETALIAVAFLGLGGLALTIARRRRPA